MTDPMPADPIALLSDLLRDGDQRIVARAFGRGDAPEIAALVQAGLLVPDGVIETTVCDACDTHHLADVVTGGTEGGYGWTCPMAGFVSADADTLAALLLSTETVAAVLSKALTAAFGRHRWTPRTIDGTDTRLLGAWCIEAASTTVVLARGLDESTTVQRTAAALRELPQNDAGLILAIGEAAALEVPRFAVVPLEAAFAVDVEGHLSVVVGALTRAIAPHAFTRLVAHVGRPSTKREVFVVLDGLAARGLTNDERDVNAGVVARAWLEFHPNKPPPSRSTLRKHIRTWRSSRPNPSNL